MYDWVMRQKGFPQFCMRTLCGKDAINTEEINFLKSVDCKIGLVIRDLTESKISSTNATEDALRAIEAAEKLGVPKNRGIAIFAEINSEWSINHNWMISFARTIFANGYTPAFIGNTDSSKNFNFDRQCSHFVQATWKDNYFGALFAATEPKRESMPTEWSPYCSSSLEPENIHLWCCGTTTFDFVMVDDVYARDEKVLDNMW